MTTTVPWAAASIDRSIRCPSMPRTQVSISIDVLIDVAVASTAGSGS